MSKSRSFISNFAGATSKSDLARLANAQTRNLFVESKGGDNYVQTVLRGMGGWKSLFTTNGAPRALYRATNGKFFWVSGDKVYCDGHQIGTCNGTEHVNFVECSGDKPYIALSDGFSLVAYDTTLTAGEMEANALITELPQYKDGQVIQPIKCHFICGSLVAVHKSGFHVSLLNPYEDDLSKYSSSRGDIFGLSCRNPSTGELILSKQGYYVEANFSNDRVLDSVVYDGKLVLIGEKSIEVFACNGGDVLYGNSLNGDSFIWQRQDALCKTSGGMACIDANSDVGWLGVDGFYVNGQKVSDDEIDRRIHDEGFTELGWLQWYSHKLFLVYTEKSTLAYDLGSRCWVEMASTFDGMDCRLRYTKCFDRYGMDSSAIVEWTEDKFDEHDGNPITKSRRSPIIGRNGDRIYIESVTVRSNVGQWEGNGTIRVWIDGNLEIDETYRLSTLGQYSTDIETYGIGEGKEFEIECRTDAKYKVAFYGLDANVYSTYN